MQEMTLNSETAVGKEVGGKVSPPKRLFLDVYPIPLEGAKNSHLSMYINKIAPSPFHFIVTRALKILNVLFLKSNTVFRIHLATLWL